MKANQYVKMKAGDEHAVSAVIGVILMVAITVSIAATVYVYASGMIGNQGTIQPVVSFLRGTDKLTVAKGDTSGNWSQMSFAVTYSNSTVSTHKIQAISPKTGGILPGQVISLTNHSLNPGVATLSVSYGDHMIGSWDFS